jgi:hypothetical protein
LTSLTLAPAIQAALTFFFSMILSRFSFSITALKALTLSPSAPTGTAAMMFLCVASAVTTSNGNARHISLSNARAAVNGMFQSIMTKSIRISPNWAACNAQRLFAIHRFQNTAIARHRQQARNDPPQRGTIADDEK